MDNWTQSSYRPNAPAVARKSLDRKGGSTNTFCVKTKNNKCIGEGLMYVSTQYCGTPNQSSPNLGDKCWLARHLTLLQFIQNFMWLWTCQPHLRNVTAVPCEIQNSRIWLKLYCVLQKQVAQLSQRDRDARVTSIRKIAKWNLQVTYALHL